MTRKLILLLTLTMALLAAKPASAYPYIYDCRGGVTWSNNDVTWKPSLLSFPVGSAWNQSIEAMRTAWNVHSPATNYRIHYTWTTTASTNSNDGQNSILIPPTSQWIWGSNTLAVTTTRRSMCYVWPGPRASLAEADIMFNPSLSWNTSTNPAPPTPNGSPSSTIVGIHEHGHGFGLDHEDDVMATMNTYYPDGGPIGTRNDAHPHADDVRGNRNAYGPSATLRDFAASAYRRTAPGQSAVIPAPGPITRNTAVSFQFTVENRGNTEENSVPVYFYLSPTRNVTTSSFYIGQATFSLGSGGITTPSAWVTIPSNAPTGYQYIGWIIDPFNARAETDEGNNGVSLNSPTLISTNNAPTACFTATPTSGNAPLHVQFNASCSSDPDGNPLTYSWDLGDGYIDSYSGAYTEYWFEQGVWHVTLTVTDSNGASSSSGRTILATCNGGFFCVEDPL